VRRAEEKPAPALVEMFTDVYEEQPWHLREQQAQCIDGPRATAEEDES
jgi:TPP-dependent pyruvate/acetoin dehydrogenase alpha subunit